MISRDTIEKIIIAGCSAPSGGNSQPWEFIVRGTTITLNSKPEKDHPILNVYNRGTFIAHGALLENMSIIATAYGINLIIKVFPDKNNELITARIELVEIGSIKPDQLSSVIFKRISNRKPYFKKEISLEVMADLKESATILDTPNAIFIHNRKSISTIAQALSLNEKITFKNRILHNLFFNEIAWNKAHEQKRGGGLVLQSLELPFPKRIMLYFLRYWPIMRIAIRFGIADQIAKDTAQIHSACSLLCCIKVSNSKEAFLNAGRQIERIWLTATKHNLSVQLNTGIFFFLQGLDANLNVSIFSDAEKIEIRKAYDSIEMSVDNKEGLITAILRIGYGERPTVKSVKSIPVIKWVN